MENNNNNSNLSQGNSASQINSSPKTPFDDEMEHYKNSIIAKSQEMNKVYNFGVQFMDRKALNDAAEHFFRAESIAQTIREQVIQIRNQQMLSDLDNFISQIRLSISHCKAKIAERQQDLLKTEGFSKYKDEIIKDMYKNKVKQLEKEKRAMSQVMVTEKKQKTETKPAVVQDELRSKIENEIICTKPGVKFNDLIGMKFAKQTLKEVIMLPTLRPELFTGLRTPSRGILLFGPPGTGKTMLAKAVATECDFTFFNISASALTSKYLGDSEKLVKHLFDIANERAPSIIFLDEMDSILSDRGADGGNEAVKRLKTEFMVQFDGLASDSSKQLLLIGATNRPFDLDNAVLRRMQKRIYIGPFDLAEREEYVKLMCGNIDCDLTEGEFKEVAKLTEGYSNSDLMGLVKEAAYEPIRDVTNTDDFSKIEKLRPLVLNDFHKALKNVRGTIKKKDVDALTEWQKSFAAI